MAGCKPRISPAPYMIGVTPPGQNQILPYKIDLSHNPHNPPVPYQTMHQFRTEMCTFHSEWCIVGYGNGVSWDLWIRSIIVKIRICFLSSTLIGWSQTCVKLVTSQIGDATFRLAPVYSISFHQHLFTMLLVDEKTGVWLKQTCLGGEIIHCPGIHVPCHYYTLSCRQETFYYSTVQAAPPCTDQPESDGHNLT